MKNEKKLDWVRLDNESMAMTDEGTYFVREDASGEWVLTFIGHRYRSW